MDKFVLYLAAAKVAFLAFSHFLAPWLVAVALPSLVAALTNKPTAAGYVRKIAHFLGVLTHADEPGTLKAPLGLGYIARTGYDAFKAFIAALKGSAALALFVVLTLTVSGCAAFRAWEAAHPKAAVILDCGKDAVVAGIETVLPDVLMALTGGSPDWSAIGKLEEAHGFDAVGCAVQAAMKQAEDASGAAAGAAEHGMRARVSANAHAYLKARNVK